MSPNPVSKVGLTLPHHDFQDTRVGQVMNRRLEHLLKSEQARNETQSQEISHLKKQMVAVQIQARQLEALAVRLARIEAKRSVMPLADARAAYTTE